MSCTEKDLGMSRGSAEPSIFELAKVPARLIPKKILMVRPANFGFDTSETAKSNAFQKATQTTDAGTIAKQAVKEFDEMVAMLRANSVQVEVFEDTADPKKADAVYPNNWVSAFPDGTVTVYPMLCAPRRLEVRKDIVDHLCTNSKRFIDLTKHTETGEFLEGTGSIVFNHPKKIAYACRSPRTSEGLFKKFIADIGYTAVLFNAHDGNGMPIYHTNVILSVGTNWNVICKEHVQKDAEGDVLLASLTADGQNSFDISAEAVMNYAGNCYEVQTSNDHENALVISESGWKAMPDDARSYLERHLKICAAKLDTIEEVGGGSARCMCAGIYF